MANTIEQIIAALPYAVSAILFLLLCFITKKVNLERSSRYKQMFMPLAAIVFCIVFLALNEKAGEWSFTVLNKITEWIASVVSRFSPNAGAYILSFPDKLLSIIPLAPLTLLLVNIITMAVYLVCKRILLVPVSIMLRNGADGRSEENAIRHMYMRFVGLIYEYDAEENSFSLKEEYRDFRGLTGAIYATSVIVSIAAFAHCLTLLAQGKTAASVYPVVTAVITGELYFALGGLFKGESGGVDVSGDNDASETVVNFIGLQRILHGLFGDKLSSSDVEIFQGGDGVSVTALLDDMSDRPDSSVQALAAYMRQLCESGFEIDRNILASAIDLIHGRSVLFSNPFYADLSPYVFYPLYSILLQGGKALIICGRHGIDAKVTDWAVNGITSVSGTKNFWRITDMKNCRSDSDVGILSADDICTAILKDDNRDFLKKVKYVIIIEPSKLITTGQIGLNAIVREIAGSDVTYCACDKVCDGLLDALSHALLVNMTEVAPARNRGGLVAYSNWNGDDEHLMRRLIPSISRYLGIGTELAVTAVKQQIGTAEWYGGDAFPVTDMRWVASQYLQELAEYADFPPDKTVFNERFVCNSDMWSAQIKKLSYTIVEDESFNLFEAYNNFASRSLDQGYVNVISPGYLLRDYMAYNAKIFSVDRKSIPNMSGDFARTERNVIIRLILLLTSYEVAEERIERELAIIGDTEEGDLHQRLWYHIVRGVTDAGSDMSADSASRYKIDDVFGIDILIDAQKYCLSSGEMERVFSIDSKEFADRFTAAVRTADYITEEETGDYTHVGSELYGHVFQKHLPGQKMTYAGKYYEMIRETHNGKILLRRSADHIFNRVQYRQIREYHISASGESKIMGDVKVFDGMRVAKELIDFSVETSAYYETTDERILKNAKYIEVSGVPVRTYKNKQALKISLPQCGAEVRYTLATLLNEVFLTLFAENSSYICAVTEDSACAQLTADEDSVTEAAESDENAERTDLAEQDGITVESDYIDIAEPDDMRRALSYSISGTYDKDAIYIFEDSEMDIGLLDSAERNLRRILAIVTDYLTWHNEMIARESEPKKETDYEPADDPTGESQPIPKRRNIFTRAIGTLKGLLARISAWLKKLFCWKKKRTPDVRGTPESGPSIEAESADTAEITSETTAEITAEDDTDGDFSESSNDDQQTKDIYNADNEDDDHDFLPGDIDANAPNPVGESAGNDADAEDGTTVTPDSGEITPLMSVNATLNEVGTLRTAKPKYSESHFLLYGYSSLPRGLDIDGTLRCLERLGYGNNYLYQARHSDEIIKQIEHSYKPLSGSVRLCDFCGRELSDVQYDVLSDGRERCVTCSKSSITKPDDFVVLFDEVLRDYERIFNVKINSPVKVTMTNAKKIAQKVGTTFVPTSGYDSRAIGLAVEKKGQHTMLIEGGAPRLTSMSTIAHELTHIWQYANWDRKFIYKELGKDGALELYEGMAVWSEIQFMFAVGEIAYAKRHEIIARGRNDEYGRGYLKFARQYPIVSAAGLIVNTPFMNKMKRFGTTDKNTENKQNDKLSESEV
ncbi:MAG: DUF4820 domain-containing protein [Oscillospiraceae bacterium]|jgi:hypothetical protein|nr:DUF4820 domain-containing protein [Oscillospiraceae bacterium]